MANNNSNQPTSKEITTQHNSIEMPYPSQPEKSREKQQQVDRPKKLSQHRKKPVENEKDKQKVELEKSENELKSLWTQYGTKAKDTEDLENETVKLRNTIANLMNKTKNKGKPMVPVTPSPPPPLTITAQIQPTSEIRRSLLMTIWNGFISIVLFLITLIRSILETLYRGLNLRTFLFVILLIELTKITIIRTVKRAHHTYLYVEPYEAVVHGTFGVDQSISWDIVWSIITSIQDFFAEVMNGGRGFGSPGYDGFVPT